MNFHCPVCGKELLVNLPSIEEVILSCANENSHRGVVAFGTRASLEWFIYTMVTEELSNSDYVRQWAYEQYVEGYRGDA